MSTHMQKTRGKGRDKSPEMGNLGHVVELSLIIRVIFKMLSLEIIPFPVPHNRALASLLSNSSPTLIFLLLFVVLLREPPRQGLKPRRHMFNHQLELHQGSVLDFVRTAAPQRSNAGLDMHFPGDEKWREADHFAVLHIYRC